jgi:hypothetical protein
MRAGRVNREVISTVCLTAGNDVLSFAATVRGGQSREFGTGRSLMNERCMGRMFQPPLTGLVPSGRWFPRLKPWAIVGRPSGAVSRRDEVMRVEDEEEDDPNCDRSA